MEKILFERYQNFRNQTPGEKFKIRRVRDLLITELTDELWLVTACDSAGGIGPKIGDSYYSEGYQLGRMLIRVPIMEVLASGAVPISVIDTLAVEMEPTGKEIIRGVKDEAASAGINASLAVTGSTEDNVKTIQTGAGAVVIGIVHPQDFRPGKSAEGDIVVSIGIPKSAPEFKVEYSDTEIANPQTITALNKLSFIHDVLPVGSKGIKHEANELAKSAGLKTIYSDILEVNISKSGGPSTVCLVSMPKENINVLKDKISQPVSIIGELWKKN